MPIKGSIQPVCGRVSNLRFRLIQSRALGGSEIWFVTGYSAFRTNRQDAQTLAKKIFPYSGSWEREIKELQNLPPRTCIAKHKLQGDIMRLRTQDVKSAHEMPGLNNLSHIGMKYLLPREEMIAQASERRKLKEEAAKAIAPAMPTTLRSQ